MVAKIQGAQRDFTYGEVDVGVKRSDELPQRKAGLRQCSNMRILNSKSVQNRPGRSAQFPAPTSSRIEEVIMSPGNLFRLAFGPGELRILNSAGTVVAIFTQQGSGAALPWTAGNLNTVVFAPLNLSIYITFDGMRPQVVTWDGVSTWSIAAYTEQVVGNQKRTPFYRLSPPNIGIGVSAQTGSVTITATAAVFTPAKVGTRIRFVGRQILITGYTSPTILTGTVEEPLPGEQILTFASDPVSVFGIGDVVIGSTSGAKGIVTGIDSPGNPNSITVQLLSSSSTTTTDLTAGGRTTSTFAFIATETVAGPSGSLAVTGASVIIAPSTVTIWDEEVMNDAVGYPRSVFVDQFRLGFCDFPSVPGGISWSAINAPTDLYVVGATVPNGGIFEVAPDKVRIQHAVAGPESSEFIFCDSKVYYIKIDVQNPLKPGSVSFQTLSSDGAAQVQPRVSQSVIFYVNAGGNSVMAVLAPGAYYRPFNTDNLCEFHNHLFTNIVALAAPNADATFNERYVYAMNADGSLACGKYDVDDGKIKAVGWVPWSGSGSMSWIAAQRARVVFTANYFGSVICEMLDDSQYLDAAISVNNLPAPFVQAGKGPLWWIAGQSVFLMDQVTRAMGVYQVDGNGFIVPQNNAGEDLTAASLVAGQGWTSIVEPFCPDANPGQDVGQRMFPRRVARFAAYVVHSTGFVLGRLFSGRITPTSPPLGTLMNSRRFPAWNQDDDPTKPPPSRETTERIRPRGRSFDPRVALIKDTPGPLQVLELGIEATV